MTTSMMMTTMTDDDDEDQDPNLTSMIRMRWRIALYFLAHFPLLTVIQRVLYYLVFM